MGNAPALETCNYISLVRDAWAVRQAIERIRRSQYPAGGPGLDPGSDPAGGCEPDERRRHPRIKLDRVAVLTPAVFEDHRFRLAAPEDPPLVIVTNDISLEGIALTHDEPLPTKYAVVRFLFPDGEPVSLAVEQRWWCRVNRLLYQSGCRVLAVAAEAP